MTSRDRVLRAIEFGKPDRVPFLHPVPALSDIFYLTSYPASDWQPLPGNAPYTHDVLYTLGNWKWADWSLFNWPSQHRRREDEFGCVREAVMADTVGEVTGHPLKNILDVESVRIPDPHRPERFETFTRLAEKFGREKFLLGDLGVGLWERAHFLRGFTDIMEDLALRPENVERLLDRLLDEWFYGMAEEYASRGCNGLIMTDDWGMQDRLMISPAMWRRIFKPRYERLYRHIHELGMKNFLHSCGNIRPILEDLIEVGLDVLQKDDVNVLAEDADRVAGRLCFMSSIDVQRVMPGADAPRIARETKKLIRRLGSHDGGIIGTVYMQPGAIGLNWGQFTVMQFYFQLFGRYGRSGWIA